MHLRSRAFENYKHYFFVFQKSIVLCGVIVCVIFKQNDKILSSNSLCLHIATEKLKGGFNLLKNNTNTNNYATSRFNVLGNKKLTVPVFNAP